MGRDHSGLGQGVRSWGVLEWVDAYRIRVMYYRSVRRYVDDIHLLSFDLLDYESVTTKM